MNKTKFNILPDIKEVKKFLIIFYIVGFTGFAIPLTRPVFQAIITLSIFANVFILLYFHEKWNFKFIFSAIFIVVTSFIIEAIGVKTGTIFGHYTYGGIFWIKLFDTPLIIGLNWLMLVYCSYSIVTKLKIPKILQLLIGPLLLVLYDFLMEPVAKTVDMWTWDNSIVPFKNYLAWYIISIVYTIFLHLMKIKINNKIASHVFIVQTAFFLILNLYFRIF